MFARNVKNGRDAGQTRFGRSARPVTLPSFMGPDPDGKLLAMYQRAKTAATKPKLPSRRVCCETAKRPKTDEYAHVRSPVGDYIRKPFISSRKQVVDQDCRRDIQPIRETTQNASTPDYDEEDYDRMDFEEKLPNFRLGLRRNKANVESIFLAGIDKVQHCKTTVEAFRCFANTFHDVLQHVEYLPTTANSSTQTSAPKLQRTQTNLIYAGFWESCTSRQNRGMQTEEQNLTFTKQPTAMLFENSCGIKSNRVKQLFSWKSFGLVFVFSAVVLGLMEILNIF